MERNVLMNRMVHRSRAKGDNATGNFLENGH